MEITKINICDSSNIIKQQYGEFILYFNNKNTKQYCQIFKSLFDDYNIAENNQHKNLLYKSLFLKNNDLEYIFDYIDNKIVLKFQEKIYFPNKKINSEEDINFINIFFDYKQSKNIINDINDILETSFFSCSEINKDNDDEYIKWFDEEGNELDFIFDNIGLCIKNNLNTKLNFIIHITPILEEYNFTIDSKTMQKGIMSNEKCIISQIKI